MGERPPGSDGLSPPSLPYSDVLVLGMRLLMTICSLGAEWKDPSKIPVKEIIEEWWAQSSRGRYESQVWNTCLGGAGRRCGQR